MNPIQTLLDTTSHRQHREALSQLLEHAFLTDKGMADYDQEVNGGDLVDKLGEILQELMGSSERNLGVIMKVDINSIPEGALEEAIHGSFSQQASDLLNSDIPAQVARLVVEDGCSAQQVLESREEA